MPGSPDFFLSLAIMLIVIAACYFASRRLYAYSLPPTYPTPLPERFSFGIFLIMVLMIFSLLTWVTMVPDFQIWKKGFWSNSIPATDVPVNRGLELYFALDGIFTLCGILFCLLLLIRKRDIFPKVFTWFLHINTGMYCMAVVVEKWILTGGFQFNVEEIRLISLNVALVLFVLWYLNTSGRVKRIFVLPHPSLVDHGQP